MGAAGWQKGAWGGLGTPLPHHIGALIPPEPLGFPPMAGKASCWLNLDMEMLREQFFAIRSKRRKLGEDPGGGRGWDTGFPPAWHWEHWFLSSLALGALGPWQSMLYGGRVAGR